MFQELLSVFIFQYGLFAIFFGSLFEGELTLIFGGIAAYLGYLDFTGVILVSIAGTLLSDHIVYYLGRRYGNKNSPKVPRCFSKVGPVLRRVGEYNTWFLFFSRFMVGMRTVIPFAVGMQHKKAAHFSLIISASALIWTIAIAGTGYMLGTAAQEIMATVQYYELVLLGIGLIPVSIYLLVNRYLSSKKKFINSLS